eukprot:1017571-Pleurochrysis_carterae.AAC.1
MRHAPHASTWPARIQFASIRPASACMQVANKNGDASVQMEAAHDARVHVSAHNASIKCMLRACACCKLVPDAPSTCAGCERAQTASVHKMQAYMDTIDACA